MRKIDGSFQADFQKDAVPPSLMALVNMILDGSNIKHQTEHIKTTTTNTALSMYQLLIYNSVNHARKESTGPVYDNQFNIHGTLMVALVAELQS